MEAFLRKIRDLRYHKEIQWLIIFCKLFIIRVNRS